MAIEDINANLPLDKAEIIAFFLESLLFGLATLLFAITIYILVFKRKSEHLNKRLVATSSLMMLLNVVHISVDLHRILEGFIYQRDGPGGPIGYLGQVWDWSHIFKTAVFVAQTCIADSFAIYRTYVVWNRIWTIVFPIMSLMATLAAGIGVLYQFTALSPDSDIFASALAGWITSFFVMTLATNFVCTSLIAGRIWYSTRKVSNYTNQTTLMPIVVILIESGSMYAASCIILVVVYLLGSNAQYPVVDGTFPIISIAFNLIIVRIALGIAHGAASANGTQGVTGVNTHTHTGTHNGTTSFAHRTTSNGFAMKPLAVTVTQLVHKNTDADDDGLSGTTPVKDSEDQTSGYSGKEGHSYKEAWNSPV